jgi:hypothetical protein
MRIADVTDAVASGLKARLAIPTAIRTIAIPQSCAEPLISRDRISCGGSTCGPSYALDVQSRLSQQQLEQALNLDDMVSRHGMTDVELILSSQPALNGCSRFYLFLRSDERAQ